jgi:hypothetical protein
VCNDRAANRCDATHEEHGRCNLNAGHKGPHETLTVTPKPKTEKWNKEKHA